MKIINETIFVGLRQDIQSNFYIDLFSAELEIRIKEDKNISKMHHIPAKWHWFDRWCLRDTAMTKI